MAKNIGLTREQEYEIEMYKKRLADESVSEEEKEVLRQGLLYYEGVEEHIEAHNEGINKIKQNKIKKKMTKKEQLTKDIDTFKKTKRQEEIALMKELIALDSTTSEDRELFQKTLLKYESEEPKVEKKIMPKKAKVTRKPKATPKPKAEKPTPLPSDVDAMKKAIKERTGKTEAECEDIISQYRILRNKSKVNGAKRIAKLKSNNELIAGTNVITPVAQIEKDAEIVKEKIEKQVEQIENKAEREVVKKDKTKDEVKVEVEKKVIKELAKLSDDMLLKSTTFVKNIQTELKKVDKTEAKNFLLGLRNEIDALLSKFGDGGSTIETYNITENESASSVNPSLFARGGGVKANNNVVRVKALIKNLDNTPYSIGLAILRERLLTYTQNDLKIMEKNPNAFGNFFISDGMYKDYFDRVIEELKFDYEDGGSVDDGDFERGGGLGSRNFDVFELETEIHQLKRKLVAQAKLKGISENFGQKEVRMLEDKYPMNFSVGQFDEWVQNFDLNSYENGGSVENDYISYIVGFTDFDENGSILYMGRIVIVAKSETDAEIKFKNKKPLSEINYIKKEKGFGINHFNEGGSVDDGDFAMGGGVGKKYILLGYSATASRDSYEDGELESVGDWDMSLSKEFSNKKDLIDYINEKIIYVDYEESNFDFESGEGKYIQTDVLCTYDDYNGYYPANEEAIKLWKQGKKELYNVHYFIDVQAVIPTSYATGGGVFAKGKVILFEENGVGGNKNKTYQLIKFDYTDGSGDEGFEIREMPTNTLMGQGTNFKDVLDTYNLFIGKNIEYAIGGVTGIDIYNLRKGDKIKTRKGDIETIERKIESGYFTKENEYSHPFESIEFVERPKRKMAMGGEVGDIDYNEILDVLKEKLEDSIQELPMDYEYSNDFKGEEVEKNSRDGFIAFTNGGYEVTWFEYISNFSGSGKSLPTSQLDDEMQRQVDYNYEIAKERFIEEYAEIVEELGEDNIDYSSLQEAGYESEAEQLSEWEMDYDGDDSILCEIGAYYYDTENYRGIEGKNTIRLYGLVNLESPYHRRGNLDDSYDIDITFDSISELKEKIDAGIKEIINWFDGKYYNDSNAEMKITRMADGGLIGNQKSIDLNENGKIDAEDFKLLRSTRNGAWRKEHKYVNSTSRNKKGKLDKTEVRYAKKNNSSRTGYKGKTNYAKGGMIKPRLKKGDDVLIIGRRWFDKVNGNTYHTAELQVNGNFVAKSGMQYGYGDNYVETGKELLLQNYKLPIGFNEKSPLYQLKDKKITFRSFAYDGLKRDLAKGGGIDDVPQNIKERLEYLRGEIRSESISYGELAELQSLAEYIEPNDVELLEPAGVPEFEDDVERNEMGDEYVSSCNVCGNDMNSSEMSDMDNVCKSCSYAKGGKVGEFKNIMENNIITEKEVNLIKMRMNNNRVDESTQEVIDYIWDNSPELTPDQNKKGIDFLRNLWKSPTGKERTNSPFGYREEQALDTFEYFELRGFYDAGNYNNKFYVPLYTCVGADSSFEYAFYNGKVNILG